MAAKTDFAIQVDSLTKKFGAKTALNDISFGVPRGSIFGFLGPNGAGKTTTIRCLMDFIRPNSGRITILDKDARQDSTDLKKRIGFLSSDLQINLNWTGEDHINFASQVKGSNKDINQLVKMLDFDKKAKAKALSTGNRQKLALILALVGQPELLIMDEPTRGLDPMLQNELYGLLRDFAAQGKTVFFSSHVLSEVQNLCDALVFIKSGKIVTDKSMSAIRGDNVHNIYAAADRPFDVAKFKKLGAEIITSSKTTVNLKVAGDLNPVVRELAKYHLTDFNVAHTDLEQIFLEQYKD